MLQQLKKLVEETENSRVVHDKDKMAENGVDASGNNANDTNQ